MFLIGYSSTEITINLMSNLTQPLLVIKMNENPPNSNQGTRLSSEQSKQLKTNQLQSPPDPKDNEFTKSTKKPTIEDFVCICQLGRGSYGEVVLGKSKLTD